MIELIGTTKDQMADICIQESLEVVTKEYDGVISSYVSGSYANDYAIPTSDIDLYLIFNRDVSREEYDEIEELGIKLKLEIDMDLIPISLEKLKEIGIIGMKDFYLHVWGNKVDHQIPEPSLENEIYRGMHGAYLRMELTRKEKPYQYPLNYPNNDELKGYDWREMTIKGVDKKSIKEIVVLTGWMATGLINWKAKKLVPTKKHCPQMFKEYIGGEVADAFSEITEYCRNKFHYLIPDSKQDFDILKSLLPKVLLIENYFLKEYQNFLIHNLNNENPIRVRTSIIRLGEILYPNIFSLEALKKINPIDDNHAEKRAISIKVLETNS